MRDQRVDYGYDPLGRLSQTSLLDGTKVHFHYDALFRRRKKESARGSQHTLWAGDTPLLDEYPDGTSIKYIFHPIDHTPLALAVDDQWHLVLLDCHGEATDLIRTADEVIVWSSEPLGFNSMVHLDRLGAPMPLRGLGQLFDEETGLIYQRARYYNPSEGRFLSPDPLGIIGSVNVYCFCLNRPFQLVDPLGLATDPCNLSEAECAAVFNRIEGRAQRMEQRWNEMEKPSQILPWFGPAYNPAAGSLGSVDGHLTAYEQEQQGMGNDLKEYYTGKCQRYEDKNRSAAMREHRKWEKRKPELPAYPRPLPAGIAGRAI
jgi:RHS repeat-associated protein